MTSFKYLRAKISDERIRTELNARTAYSTPALIICIYALLGHDDIDSLKQDVMGKV